jgi:hypothetical protein
METQRTVTYAILIIFGVSVATVLVQSDQAERSTILQTVINLTTLAAGYWLRASSEPPQVPQPPKEQEPKT